MRDAQLRQVRGQGVLVSEAAALELDGAVFEDTLVAGDSVGRAVEVKGRSQAVVRGAELWNTEGAAFFVQGSNAKLEVFDSVVTQTQTVGEGYTTIAAFANGGGALELTGVVFSDQHGIGLLANDTGSSITTERVTVERTFINQHGQDGWAIAALGPAQLDLRNTTVRSFYGAGVLVAGATASFSQLRLEDGRRGMELSDPPAVTVQGGGCSSERACRCTRPRAPPSTSRTRARPCSKTWKPPTMSLPAWSWARAAWTRRGSCSGAPGADTGVFVQPRRSGATLALTEADIAAHGFAAVFLTEPAEVHIAGSVLRGGPGRQPGTEGPLLHGNALFVGNESAGTGTICVEHSTLADSRVGVLLHGVDPALLACPEPGGSPGPATSRTSWPRPVPRRRAVRPGAPFQRPTRSARGRPRASGPGHATSLTSSSRSRSEHEPRHAWWAQRPTSRRSRVLALAARQAGGSPRSSRRAARRRARSGRRAPGPAGSRAGAAAGC